jgi:predicted alpha/beta hydrolase
MWEAVRRRLGQAGITSSVVELPMTDLAADVAATQRVLAGLDAPVVSVGHSYGGAVITEAGAHPQVAHLLYLAAFPLSDGESVGRTLPDLDVPPDPAGRGVAFPRRREGA